MREIAAVIRSVAKGDSNRAGRLYGRITSSSSESGTVGDDRRVRRVRRDDERVERVERAMVELLLFNFWLYCLVCVYTSAICAALRDNTSNLCFELKKSENNDFCPNIPLYSITRVVANLRIWLTNFVVHLYHVVRRLYNLCTSSTRCQCLGGGQLWNIG